MREFGKVEGTCSEGIWEGGGNMQLGNSRMWESGGNMH